jgi:rifampin ADP-ribosylating transferase
MVPLPVTPDGVRQILLTEFVHGFDVERVGPDAAAMIRCVNDDHASATPSIAEAIAAAGGTSHVPVTFESYEHVEGPFFHGTRFALAVGDLLVPGRPSNFEAGRISNNVYFTALFEPAVWGAELAAALGGSGERGRIYVVEPTGPFEDDPNVTDKKFPGNVTRSYRTRHPMRVISEVQTWEGHPPEVLQGMLDNLARLREQGLDVIED